MQEKKAAYIPTPKGGGFTPSMITGNQHDALIEEELKYYSRGQIISTYDCTEYQVDDYFIYQI